MDVPRIIITAHDGTAKGDLDARKVIELTTVAEVNGEHSMSITTMQELVKGDRLLNRDGMGAWHEYVVESIESSHETAGVVIHTYWCPWSVQHDLSGTFVTGMPGTGGTPATASEALLAALAGTERWTRGEVGITTTGSASFWRMSGWEALQELASVWGGEVRADITVGSAGVVSRSVSLVEHVGSATASRRFDYGFDTSGIRRTVADQLWTARVMPLGASEQTDTGGYGRKITIEDANGGVAWIENPATANLTRVPDGAGGWEYPVQVVENGECKTPDELLAWATEHLDEWTTPKVSYEADVIQLSLAGMDAHGVAEGDEVAVVDRTFGTDGLRISGRALRIEEDLLQPSNTQITITNLRDTLGDTLGDLARANASTESMVTNMGAYQASSEYISSLLARLNSEANATGGFTYITQGQGIRTYDVPVSDPLVGAEATSCVEVKGGTIRIATKQTADSDWDWRLVFTDGHVVAEMVTALNVTAGWIQGINGTYIDLDSGTVLLGDSAGFHMVADSTELGFYQGQTRVAYVSNEMLYVPLAVGVNAIQVGDENSTSWQWKLRSNGNFQLKYVGQVSDGN